MVDVKTGYAEVNGARLYYEVAGSGHPFVMVHAGIASRSMWDDQFEYFAKKYQVIRYDMRGYGLSEPVAGDYQRHEDIRAMLDFLKVDHAYLMGCSMGGGACMNFALEYPERADALIMVGSGPGGFSYDDWAPGPLDEAMEAAYEKGDMAQVNEVAMQIFVDGIGRTPDQVNPALRKKVYEMNAIAIGNEGRNGKDVPLATPAAARMSHLKLPVLVIVGDLDEEYIARAANFMAEKLPNVQRFDIHGTAHLPNMEFPNEVNARVEKFLNEVEGK